MCNSSPDLQRQDQPTSVWASASRLPLPYQSVTLKYFSKFSGRKHCQQKSEDKIPWLFPDLRKEIRFPWQTQIKIPRQFPDLEILFFFTDFSLTVGTLYMYSPDPWIRLPCFPPHSPWISQWRSWAHSKTGIKDHSFRFVLERGPESVSTPKAAREKRVNYETLSRSDKQPMS